MASGPRYVFSPMMQSRPTLAPLRMWTVSHTAVPGPMVTPSSMIAVGWMRAAMSSILRPTACQMPRRGASAGDVRRVMASPAGDHHDEADTGGHENQTDPGQGQDAVAAGPGQRLGDVRRLDLGCLDLGCLDLGSLDLG